MLAAASVNVSYLLILLVPSVIACGIVALTWRSRARRQREADDEQRRRAALPPGSGAKSRGPASKPRKGSAAKPRGSSPAKRRNGSAAKRRRG
jgi:hypothetical protein